MKHSYIRHHMKVARDAEDRMWPELDAVTIDNWSDDDIADEPEFAVLSVDIRARRFTADVLRELHSCLDRDWCMGQTRIIFLTVLAAHDGLDEFDPAVVYSRRMRTITLLGKRWIV